MEHSMDVINNLLTGSIIGVGLVCLLLVLIVVALMLGRGIWLLLLSFGLPTRRRKNIKPPHPYIQNGREFDERG